MRETPFSEEEWYALPDAERQSYVQRVLHRHLERADIVHVRRLYTVITAGLVDGSTYWDPAESCGCLLGWLYVMKTGDSVHLTHVTARTHLPFRWRSPTIIGCDHLMMDVDPLELYTCSVQLGDTPSSNNVLADVAMWIAEYVKTRGKVTTLQTGTPAETRFREAVRRVHARGLLPTPTRVLTELGKDVTRADGRGGPLLNGRESQWRRHELKALGYRKDPWTGRWNHKDGRK